MRNTQVSDADEFSFDLIDFDETESSGEDTEREESSVLLVEFPPGGIQGVTCGHVRNESPLPKNLASQNVDDDFGVRSLASTTTSYVAVAQVQGFDEESTSCTSYSYREVSGDVSIGSSLSKTFEKVPLDPEIVECKVCTFHNPEGSTVCEMCGSSLGENSRISDTNLAGTGPDANDMLDYLVQREKQRENLREYPPLGQAKFLVEEVQSHVEAYDGCFEMMPWISLRTKALYFIGESNGLPGSEMLVGYVFTTLDKSLRDYVANVGFKPSKNFNFPPTIPVFEDLEDAWKSYVEEPESRLGRALFNISEDENNECEVEAAQGYVVLIPQGRLSKGFRYLVDHKKVLPLVPFGIDQLKNQEMAHFQSGLQTICRDFFDALCDSPPDLSSIASTSRHYNSSEDASDESSEEGSSDGSSTISSSSHDTNHTERMLTDDDGDNKNSGKCVSEQVRGRRRRSGQTLRMPTRSTHESLSLAPVAPDGKWCDIDAEDTWGGGLASKRELRERSKTSPEIVAKDTLIPDPNIATLLEEQIRRHVEAYDGFEVASSIVLHIGTLLHLMKIFSGHSTSDLSIMYVFTTADKEVSDHVARAGFKQNNQFNFPETIEVFKDLDDAWNSFRRVPETRLGHISSDYNDEEGEEIVGQGYAVLVPNCRWALPRMDQKNFSSLVHWERILPLVAFQADKVEKEKAPSFQDGLLRICSSLQDDLLGICRKPLYTGCYN